MALWEPVGGVFTAVASAPKDAEWSLVKAAIVLVALVLISLIVVPRIASKRIGVGSDWSLRQHMTELGAAATALYLVAITTLLWGRLGTLSTMPLNEVGDFFAGAFGPVAFLWLVLGFLQQGDELRQGTQALLLQASELKHSVEQQAIMAAAAHADHDELMRARKKRYKAIAADFSLTMEKNSEGRRNDDVYKIINIHNCGAKASNIVVTLGEPFLDKEVKASHIGTNAEAVEAVFLPYEHDVQGGKAVLTYNDDDDNPRQELFAYSIVNNHADFRKLS